ncbi:hypothetical protein [Pantoea agglomerans]|uniref:hypothetical protein n=2 Tax=Enterobacter agglomerans TaxID=549 RepID=UPI0016541154|nr:hypothetical protein [Pantoea agglomerans]
MKRNLNVTLAEEMFLDCARSNNFSIHSDLALITDDPTLLFTNSTIVAFKTYISDSKLISPGFAIVQPCLRTQNLRNIRNSSELSYMSYFKQAGVIGDHHSLDNILNLFDSYFIGNCKVNAERILFKTSVTLPFNQSMKQAFPDISCVYDTEGTSFYRWKYGMNEVEGYGLTFSIKNSIDNEYYDVGNIIQLRQNSTIIGYEFGFGIETFLSRLYSTDTPFDFAGMKLDFIENLPILVKNKFTDLATIIAILLSLQLKPGRGGRESILRKALSDFFSFVFTFDICFEDVLHSIVIFLKDRSLSINNVEQRLAEIYAVQRDKYRLAKEYITYCQRHLKTRDFIIENVSRKYGFDNYYYSFLFDK